MHLKKMKALMPLLIFITLRFNMKLEDFNTKNNINSNSHVIELGQRALDSLNFARKHLKSASRFGLFDSLGGSIFMSLGKYQKIQGFKTEFQLACDDLKAFENELLNIHYDFDINIDINNLTYIMDIFTDNIITDLIVYKKINNALKKLDDLIDDVENVLKELKNDYE